MKREHPPQAQRPTSHAKLRPVGPVLALSALACGGAGLWALWPLPPTGVPDRDALLAELEAAQHAAPFTSDTDPASDLATELAGELAAFERPLWVIAAAEQPPPPDPEPRPTQAPPLRATLLAIARDAQFALVHDQQTDSIITLRAGSRLQGRTVTRLDASRVTLAVDGQPRQTQTLELGYTLATREAAANGSPGALAPRAQAEDGP